jgi:hypothetical protein
VAGVIKTVLMLERRELVPTLHFTRPNPLLDLDATPFSVCTQAGPRTGSPIAAISSFGLGVARTGLRILYSELLERFEDFSLAGPPERLRSIFVSGYKHVPITARARHTPRRETT